MRVGPYSLSTDSFRAAGRHFHDSLSRVFRGIPRVPGETPEAIAAEVLRQNARDVFWAGRGHFRACWPADLGKAFRGALDAVPRPYLRDLLRRFVSTSVKEGEVPTCFTSRGHYTLPYPRADGAPWLLDMVDALDDAGFLAEHHRDLERVANDWARANLEKRTGLVSREVTGDWMDTIPRASSTYNNLCALRALRIGEKWGLSIEGVPSSREMEARLLAERWTGTHLRDHHRSGTYVSADANVPALYWGLLPVSHRRAMARALEDAGLNAPVPMRCREGRYAHPWRRPLTLLYRGYHSVHWPHLGLMLVNGLRRLGEDPLPLLERVARGVRRHGNFLEVLDERGDPYVHGPIVCEYGFTMAAGQYLEAIAPRGVPRAPEPAARPRSASAA